ncbi:MAG: class I SAM-dependent methyltransferase [Bacteroidota bacterium]
MDKGYYAQYYEYERSHWWFKVRAKILMEKVAQLTQGRKDEVKILNIGVATGRTTELLNKYGSVTSVEYDEDCCQFLREELNIDAINASITELPFENDSFDLVCAFDVIEHVEDDQLSVDEMVRVCKEEGSVFVTVPAFMDLWSEHDEINHHQRRYLRPRLVNLFKEKSGKVSSTYFNTLLFIPIYVVRSIFKLFPKLRGKSSEAQSDFEVMESKMLNSILYVIFSIEKYLLRFMKFPFGVSILLTFKRV